MSIKSEISDYKMNDTFSASMFKMNFIVQRREPGTDVVYVAPAIGEFV